MRNTARQGWVVSDSFAHNSRSELVEAQVNGKDYEYACNRTSALEESSGVASRTEYTANELNQYTAIAENDADAFVPQFDADGNQTLIKTETGIWSAVYNAENRPVSFTNSESNTVVECSYDSQGRRSYKKVTTNGSVTFHRRFIYRGYLQIAAIDLTRSHHPVMSLLTWDPTQPVATRPLAIQINGTWYTYGWDLTKNICELYSPSGAISTSYTYTPFGQVTASGSISQPIQWSSEVWDGEMGLVYYNWRYYGAMVGRWIRREPLHSQVYLSYYQFADNDPIICYDVLGNISVDDRKYKRVYLSTPIQQTGCKKVVRVFIGGARDSQDGNMNRLYKRIANDDHYNDGEMAYYYWANKYMILAAIREYWRICPNSKVVLLGHSYGGDTAMDVAESLKGREKVVLVTLDPVSNFDAYNWKNKRPKSIEYWINAYVEKNMCDIFAPIPIAGQLISGVYTLFTSNHLDAIASLGGKWGHEDAADVNIAFRLNDRVNHAMATALFINERNDKKKSAQSYLDEYLK